MSVTWYAKRLARMSPAEVAHRVAEQAKRSVSRTRPYGWAAFPSDLEPVAVPGLAETVRRTVAPPLAEAVAAASDRLLDGHFGVHGVDWPRRDPGDLFPDAVWRLDPVTGRSWPGPDRYCFDLPYRHVRDLGDVKYVWDFNRLQFLQPLAARVATDGDERALAAVASAIEGWARCNAPYRGIGWNSGIELALRAVSLIVAVSLCGDRLPAACRARTGQILAAHLYWLRRYPSLYSSANNHLVAEALGIYLIASVMPRLAGAETARRAAKAVLVREARLQILPDGVGAEQSPTYGAFTAEMLLVADVVGRAFGDPLGEEVGGRLEAFATYVAWLSDRHGRTPAIGDDDEGRIITLSGPRERAYPASVARAIAGHRGIASPIPGGEVEPELRDALVPAPRGAEPAPRGLRSFEAGGYTIVREARGGRRMHLVVDHGPLGYLSIAAHGHADAAAIVLDLDDEPVLVDPGTYLYHSGAEWRDWFRGTRAHNTLAVEGADQSVIAGPFNWSQKATGRLDGVGRGEDWALTASHDGYLSRFGVRHVRTVSALPDGIEIHDALPGGGARPRRVEVILQFAPGLSVEGDGATRRVARGTRTILTLALPPAGRITTRAGEPGCDGGWVSPAFGLKEPATRLAWTGTMPAEGLRTRLRWA